jgi:hypothetical protein
MVSARQSRLAQGWFLRLFKQAVCVPYPVKSTQSLFLALLATDQYGQLPVTCNSRNRDNENQHESMKEDGSASK